MLLFAAVNACWLGTGAVVYIFGESSPRSALLFGEEFSYLFWSMVQKKVLGSLVQNVLWGIVWVGQVVVHRQFTHQQVQFGVCRLDGMHERFL